MNIEKNTAVTVRLNVSELSGRVLDDGKEPMAYLHGYGNLPQKVEDALEGQSAGYKVSLDLQPAEAFGERDEALLQTIPRSEFPPGVKVGGQLQGPDQSGQMRVYTVMKIKGQEVFLDGNHPLAGLSLRFAVDVVSVRAATEEELEHGHVHGDGGHHH